MLAWSAIQSCLFFQEFKGSAKQVPGGDVKNGKANLGLQTDEKISKEDRQKEIEKLEGLQMETLKFLNWLKNKTAFELEEEHKIELIQELLVMLFHHQDEQRHLQTFHREILEYIFGAFDNISLK